MPHDDQFTATGPAFTGAGFSRAAFSTGREGTDSTYGVNVEGSVCGVYGKCVKDPGSSRDSDVDGVGVFGMGDFFGVYGQGNFGIVGVIGTQNNIHRPRHDGVGVIGAVMRGGTGVVGVSLQSLTALVGQKEIPDSADGDGVGVFGASGDGSGVRGSSAGGTGGEFSSGSGRGASGESDSGTGVVGNGVIGVEGVGTSIGVSGHGREEFDVKVGVLGRGATGVRGEAPSDGGVGVLGVGQRGGVFRSKLAQVRLVPLKLRTPVGNIAGEAGDLVATQGQVDDCSLWFCVRSGDASTAKWKHIA